MNSTNPPPEDTGVTAPAFAPVNCGRTKARAHDSDGPSREPSSAPFSPARHTASPEKIGKIFPRQVRSLSELTRGQRKFFDAVARGERAQFHRSVIEPIEGMPYGKPGGLVRFVGSFRLVGRNSYNALDFVLTDEGVALTERVPS